MIRSNRWLYFGDIGLTDQNDRLKWRQL